MPGGLSADTSVSFALTPLYLRPLLMKRRQRHHECALGLTLGQHLLPPHAAPVAEGVDALVAARLQQLARHHRLQLPGRRGWRLRLCHRHHHHHRHRDISRCAHASSFFLRSGGSAKSSCLQFGNRSRFPLVIWVHESGGLSFRRFDCDTLSASCNR